MRGVAAAIVAACLVIGCKPVELRPPDVFLIVIDTARADRFGCYGYERDTTPRIDAFAQEAVLFRNARAPAPWTLPSHASMFTGLRPSEHGLHWSPKRGEGRLRPKVGRMKPVARERLLASQLAGQGYRTIGVSNNHWVSSRTGLADGFETFFEVPHKPDQWRPAARQWLRRAPESRSAAGVSIELFLHALETVDADAPLFAFFNLIEPHFPYVPDRDYLGRFGGDTKPLAELFRLFPNTELAMLGGAVQPDPDLLGRLYDEELLHVDAMVGRLLAELRQRGRYQDALIIVTSDHGEHLGEDGRYSHQLSLDDALLRVPLIIRFPRGRDGGTVVEEALVSVQDIHRTVLSVAGVEPDPGERRSQDLGAMSAFTRDWALAEYFYSPLYLEQVRRAAKSFDPRPHERVRRLVLMERERVELGASASETPSLPPGVVAELERYLAGQGDAAREPTLDPGADPETLEALRALGYLE